MTTEILIPLESNPDVMNKFLQKLGVPSEWEIVDVMGIDPDMLMWVPRPVLAVILLFPELDTYKGHKEEEEAAILSKGQVVSEDVFFMRQYVRNACGTIALVHCLANNTDKFELSDGPLKTFLADAKGLDYVGKGKVFQKCEGIINAHKELSLEGQTNIPPTEEHVDHHFIAFVHKDGALYELDGSKSFPINHGSTTPDSLLEDSIEVVKKFMARNPDEVRYTIVALAAQD